MKRAIINFYELSDEWQDEARRNAASEVEAEETMYLEPDDDANPKEHILWDLNEAMRGSGNHKGFKYNATIGISNNSAMLLNVSDNGEEAEIKFV